MFYIVPSISYGCGSVVKVIGSSNGKGLDLFFFLLPIDTPELFSFATESSFIH